MSPTSKPTAPVDVYIRVSQVGGRGGASYYTEDDQREKAEALASARGFAVGETFLDRDQSGGKMSRPDFDRMMERVRSGESGGVAVAYLSRLARNLAGLDQTAKEIEAAGGVLLIGDLNIDTSTPTGRLMLQVLGAVTEFEREQQRERWDGNRTRFLERGGHAGPLAPAGYDRTVIEERPDGRPVHGPLVPNGDAPAIREAFRMRGRGEPIRAIAEALTEAGARFRTFTDGPEGGKVVTERSDWRESTVRSMLRSPVYTGEARVAEDKVKKGAHPAIVTEAEWRRAQRGQRKTSRGGEKRPGALLASLCVCGSCGGPMTNDGIRYRCNPRGRGGHCDHRVTVEKAALEEYVESAAGRRVLETVGYHEQSDAPEAAAEDRRAAERAVERARADLAEVEEARETLSPLAYGRAVAEAEERVAAAEDALLDEREASEDPGPTWDELVAQLEDVGERRQAIARLVERVVVRPVGPVGRRGVPMDDRVEIVWR